MPETVSSVAPPSQADLDTLNKLITAINSLNAEPYFAAAQVFFDASVMLGQLSMEVQTKAEYLTTDQGGAKGWTGAGADAFKKVAEELRTFIMEFSNVVQRREIPTRDAGNDVVELRSQFDQILRANANNFGGGDPTRSRTPTVPKQSA
ncbi:hypothetical protein ACFS5L_34510 [Streptomyces phyllanthi]|uniref:Uncharacterized protein n=1 Tax=Streptomyces phyllanthi TaxID=1803180 RepID=A0A5N8VZV3_9ACTN|nr:hypothetical protein [Streptomyces phyllanthi]MPY40509.1 hypothetical protein [Streptomyces phyllanthi]